MEPIDDRKSCFRGWNFIKDDSALCGFSLGKSFESVTDADSFACRNRAELRGEWLHICDWVRDAGGFLTCRFSNSKSGREPQVVFSGKHVKALLHSLRSFSVHRAKVIRFPTHTVSFSVNDVSLERVYYMETVKWVIIIENIACGCSYQWHPPNQGTFMHVLMNASLEMYAKQSEDMKGNYIVILECTRCILKSKIWLRVESFGFKWSNLR